MDPKTLRAGAKFKTMTSPSGHAIEWTVVSPYRLGCGIRASRVLETGRVFTDVFSLKDFESSPPRAFVC